LKSQGNKQALDIYHNPFQGDHLTSTGWTLQQSLLFNPLTGKTRCAQTVAGLYAPFIKSL